MLQISQSEREGPSYKLLEHQAASANLIPKRLLRSQTFIKIKSLGEATLGKLSIYARVFDMYACTKKVFKDAGREGKRNLSTVL